MSACHLAGNASTNSRGSRPLPPGAVSARVLSAFGATEIVEFTFADGRVEQRQLLSWTVGQHGCLWAFSPPADWLHKHAGRMPSSYGHRDEYELADVLGDALGGVFGGTDLAARFYQDGATPLAAAARLARHATGRWPIASYGYHGAGAEWAHEPASAGILKHDISHHWRFEWGEVERVRQLAMSCAAICVEVPALDDEAAIAAFLRECRAACDEGGAVFILDETVTGFRLALGGAAERYGVVPDIATYGKAISAAGCVSAIVGKRELVAPIGGPVFLSTTFGGHPGQVAIAAETVRALAKERDFIYEHLRHIGAALKDGLNQRGIRTIGQVERSLMVFDTDADWLGFCSRLLDYGVSMHRPQFPTLKHRDLDVTLTLAAAEKALAR